MSIYVQSQAVLWDLAYSVPALHSPLTTYSLCSYWPHHSAHALLIQLLSTMFIHAADNNDGHAQQACSALLQVQSRTA